MSDKYPAERVARKDRWTIRGTIHKGEKYLDYGFGQIEKIEKPKRSKGGNKEMNEKSKLVPVVSLKALKKQVKHIEMQWIGRNFNWADEIIRWAENQAVAGKKEREGK